MTVLRTEADSDEGELSGYIYDDAATVRIVGNEEGDADKVGIDAWFNSARIHVDPERDEVTCVVSVGDPRGGFAFTVRRNGDGHLLIHTPYPGEGMPHMRTKQVNDGTLIVVGDRGGEPLVFIDEESLNREAGWRDGWDEMTDGVAMPEGDGPYGILYDAKRDTWAVRSPITKKAPTGFYDVVGFEDADSAAERAEELNAEFEEEEEED